MVLFTGDASGPNVAVLQPFYPIGIFNNDNNQKFNGNSALGNWMIGWDPPNTQGVPIIFPLCIQNPPTLNYNYAVYTMTVDLPNNVSGYTAVYQTCCRISGLVNVGNSAGSTYNCSIPGNPDVNGPDSSPRFKVPVSVICKNAFFTLDFGATDPDPQDSLVYSLCDAYNGGAATGSDFEAHAAPPYGAVPYGGGYSGSAPMGAGVSIDSRTGIISGMAPDEGKYVVCVCINVYRDGVLIGKHRKDLIVQVSNCNIISAVPTLDKVTCDGLNFNFSHASNGASSVFWDFGDLTTLADTSNENATSYTYPNPGDYVVKLVINRSIGCADSTLRTIGVWPGFNVDFSTVGSCFTNPYEFRDGSGTVFGNLNSWKWNFGDETTAGDVSSAQFPTWQYSTAGNKNVSLTVTNTKGCTKTIEKIVNVLDKPVINLAFKDTLICIPDAVTLAASGQGIFSWTPLSNISDPNVANPTVNPTTSTWYVAHLNEQGCINKDSVHVSVVADVTLNMMNDTTICRTDGVQLTAVTDGLQFTWTPASTLNDPNILNAIATPVDPVTTYEVLARIGSCSKTGDVIVTTVPYPVANAGPPQSICYNTAAQMNASHDGLRFTWTPTSYLSDPLSLSPVSTPPRTTQYILSSYDTKGCPKPGHDTLVITVMPKMNPFAGRDTMVIVGQPLLFAGSGGVGYHWTPPTGLDNPNISSPIGSYGKEIDSIRYKLIVSDAIGCKDSAFVKVTVFKTKPSVFVPTAFTPNGDGRNDLVRPIAVGVKQINYFSIYNRWGQMVFKTTINGQGWDGCINGTLQSSNVFVWMVSAIDYQGNPIFLKGTVALIR